jgi:hypothetical protein
MKVNYLQGQNLSHSRKLQPTMSGELVPSDITILTQQFFVLNQEQVLQTNWRMAVYCDAILGAFAKLLKEAISSVMAYATHSTLKPVPTLPR